MNGMADEWVKRALTNSTVPKLELSASWPLLFPYCLRVGLSVLWIPGAVFCGQRWVHSVPALEEEPAAGKACPGVGGGDESRDVHLQPAAVLD